MCFNRAINSPMICALDIQQICILQDMLGSSTGTETENLYLLWQEVARQVKGDRKIIQICGKKALQLDWESYMGGRGTGGEGNQAGTSSKGGHFLDNIVQLLDDQCPL